MRILPLRDTERPLAEALEQLGPLAYFVGLWDGTGVDVAPGPDGRPMETGLKEAYTALLQGDGGDVVYAGNGVSDIYPARRARHVFATGDLLGRCREEKLACTPFDDFNDIILGLESLWLG